MSHEFDPGYGAEPFRTLVSNAPDETVYPTSAFRTKWGPVFHRGRLDGSARLLILGQDPAQHETISRRILVGEAGQRVQGFLAKLGTDRSYVMVNTFLYSVYGQGGGEKHKNDPNILAYRNRWIDAVFDTSSIEAVVALGGLADAAWQAWKQTPKGQATHVPYAHITHPTQPESSSKGDKAKRQAAIKVMLANWNTALNALKPALHHPDHAIPLKLYGTDFQPDEIVEIPEADMPAGTPPWMRGLKSWATRTGKTPALKRVTITVTIPKAYRPS
ncbi:MAG: uracil-DNA glycosylase family protein [Terriglobia bacterium]